MNTVLENEIFNVNEHKFNDLALKIFHFQYGENQVFRQWVNLLHPSPDKINSIDEIPFMPVSLFKNNRIITGNGKSALQFQSSTTTGQIASVHEVLQPELYHFAIQSGFTAAYGSPYQYSILALLPSYLERGNSGLVYMAKYLMDQTSLPSDFYMYNLEEVVQQLADNESKGIKTILLGVTYSLLDLTAVYTGKPLLHTTIMETGGMKGRRRELTKAEVHETLCRAFGVYKIHSEYGMTELLSQAYSAGDGLYVPSPTMKIHITDPSDPLQALKQGKTGRICIVDLANLYSCSFLATDDLGKKNQDQFEIMGRFDFSDVRGCNLMADNF